MAHLLWDAEGKPLQDKEVTSVLQYFTGAVLVVAALLFEEPCPAMVRMFSLGTNVGLVNLSPFCASFRAYCFILFFTPPPLLVPRPFLALTSPFFCVSIRCCYPSEPFAAQVMFLAEGGLLLAFGFGTNNSLMPGVTYYDTASPTAARIAYVFRI